MRKAAAPLLGALLLCAALPLVAGYPSYWVNRYASNACSWPTSSTLSKGHPVSSGTSDA
jgi:hypothetical protein